MPDSTSQTQYLPHPEKMDHTRDAAYDLYAAIGVAERAVAHISPYGFEQQTILQKVLEELASAKDRIRQFIAHRNAMPSKTS